jgi:hypothetical protein
MVLKAELEYRTKGGPFQGAVTIRIFFVKKLFFDYLVEQRAPLPPSGRSTGLPEQYVPPPSRENQGINMDV